MSTIPLNRISIIVLLMVWIASGRAAPGPGEVLAQAAPACPAPNVDTANWADVLIQVARVRLKLPARYKEKSPGMRVGDSSRIVSYRAGEIDHIDFEADSGTNGLISKVVRQPHYQDYSECAEERAGGQLNIQSFRGGGTIFLAGRATPLYEVMAFYQVSPAGRLRITSGFSTRQAQEEALAMLRTITSLK
ncbi:MAG: hypothetical protein ABR611_08420 [Chthoniobacterales bacterium]